MKAGFTINLSADDPPQADRLTEPGIAGRRVFPLLLLVVQGKRPSILHEPFDPGRQPPPLLRFWRCALTAMCARKIVATARSKRSDTLVSIRHSGDDAHTGTQTSPSRRWRGAGNYTRQAVRCSRSGDSRGFFRPCVRAKIQRGMRSGTKAICCRIFTPALDGNPN